MIFSAIHFSETQSFHTWCAGPCSRLFNSSAMDKIGAGAVCEASGKVRDLNQKQPRNSQWTLHRKVNEHYFMCVLRIVVSSTRGQHFLLLMECPETLKFAHLHQLSNFCLNKHSAIFVLFPQELMINLGGSARLLIGDTLALDSSQDTLVSSVGQNPFTGAHKGKGLPALSMRFFFCLFTWQAHCIIDQ